MKLDNDCTKPCKARESLPDILESIRRGMKHAHFLDSQLMRIEQAYGRKRVTSTSSNPPPTPPLITMVEDEATKLADYLLVLQEALKRELDLLFGVRV